MQPTSSGGGGGLSRFRSAPATWLEALLESEEEDVIIDPPKPKTLTPTPPPPPPSHQQPSSIAGTTSRPTYVDPNIFLPTPVGLRQKSSPAGFFSQINNPDAYLSNYSMANYEDYLSSSYSTLKPSRGVSLDDQQAKFTTQLSGDQSALLDVEMDKLMGDTVPFRVRAKRGCATHPRSIAERVRRTRIGDRIRKLQELVPNMDKQTNTADMLEEAVEYVKFLQRQIQGMFIIGNKPTKLIYSYPLDETLPKVALVAWDGTTKLFRTIFDVEDEELREDKDKCTCAVNDRS